MVEEKKKQGPDLSRCGLCTVKKKKVHNSDIRPFFFALENVVQNHLFHLVFWRWENVNIFWVFYCPPFSLFLKTFEFW